MCDRPPREQLPTLQHDQCTPNHHKRQLSVEQRNEMRNVFAAVHCKFFGQGSWRETMRVTPPNELRETLLYAMCDQYLVAGFLALTLFDPQMRGVIFQYWKKIGFAELLRLIWHCKFDLRVDQSTVYFFGIDQRTLSLPISSLTQRDDTGPLYMLGELVARRHLWLNQTTTVDLTMISLGDFALLPELRAMINRVELTAALCASFLCDNRAEMRSVRIDQELERIERAWLTEPSQFSVELSDWELHQLRELWRVTAVSKINVAKLNPFVFDVCQESYADHPALQKRSAEAANESIGAAVAAAQNADDEDMQPPPTTTTTKTVAPLPLIVESGFATANMFDDADDE
jgi:hypothetical protein